MLSIVNFAKLPQGQQWTQVEVLSSSPSLTKIMPNQSSSQWNAIQEIPATFSDLTQGSVCQLLHCHLQGVQSTTVAPLLRVSEVPALVLVLNARYRSLQSNAMGSNPAVETACGWNVRKRKDKSIWRVSWNLQTNKRKKTWITSSSVKQML